MTRGGGCAWGASCQAAPAPSGGRARPSAAACWAALAVTLAGGAGCAPSVAVRRDDPYLTVDAHEREAAAEEAHGRALVEAGASTASVGARTSAAAAHRAAARALQDGEATACAQLPLGLVEAGAFPLTTHRVETIHERSTSPVPAPMRARPGAPLAGARLIVHGSLTSSELTALLTCRAARARARGDGGIDPVEVRDATFVVRPLEGGDLSVEIRAPSEAGAGEVLRRARLLAER